MLLLLVAAAMVDAQALCCCPAVAAAAVVVVDRTLDKVEEEAAAGVARDALPAELAQAGDEEKDETPPPLLRPFVTTLCISPAAAREVDVAMGCGVAV